MSVEPPYSDMWRGWPRRLFIANGAIGGLALLALALATDDGASRLRLLGQALLLPVLALLGALNPWRISRVIGTVLAAVGAVITAIGAATDPGLFSWFITVALGGMMALGVVSLWRPDKVVVDPYAAPKRRLSPGSARRIVVGLGVVVAVLVIVVALLIIWLNQIRS